MFLIGCFSMLFAAELKNVPKQGMGSKEIIVIDGVISSNVTKKVDGVIYISRLHHSTLESESIRKSGLTTVKIELPPFTGIGYKGKKIEVGWKTS